MTGYGIFRNELPDKVISVEIKSVNHRYSDFNVRTPRSCGFLDELIRRRLSDYISRGKVDVYVCIDWREGCNRTVQVNRDLAAGYVAGLNSLKEAFDLEGTVSLEQLSYFQDIFKVEQMEPDTEILWQEVSATLERAADEFVAMRRDEGQRLADDITARSEAVLKAVAQLEERAPQIIANYTERLKTRMTELLGNLPYDETRLITEVAVYADKTDINEELVRLKSHISQLGELMHSRQPIGRKLDFIIQELNREINTIGSKGNDIEISRIVVEIKSELEKLREQAQNIE